MMKLSRPIIDHNSHEGKRKAVAENVFQEITKYAPKSYLFGGYVRDHIAGLEFNDVDIYIPRDYDVYRLIDLLNRNSETTKYVTADTLHPAKSYIDDPTFGVDKITIVCYDKDTGTVIDLDLVQSRSSAPGQDHPYPDLDMDVNCLGVDAKYNLFSPLPEYNNDTALNAIFGKIKNRNFTVVRGDLQNSSNLRVMRMKSKGYSSSPFPIPKFMESAVLAPPPIVLDWAQAPDRTADSVLTYNGKEWVAMFAPIDPSQDKNIKSKEKIMKNMKVEAAYFGAEEASYPAMEAKAAKAAAIKVMGETNKPKFLEILAKDAEKGAYRTGATQGIKALKTAVSKILSHEGFEDSKASVIMELFDTPIGEGLLRMALGYGLMMAPIPGIQENKYAQNLSEELRVSGMSGGMDYAADLAGKFLVPALMEAYQNTPLMENFVGPKKLRLDEPEGESELDSEEIHVEVEEQAGATRASK